MCEFEKKLIAWIDGELETDAALEVERHLSLCETCSAKVDQYREVSRAFAAYHAATPMEKSRSGFRWLAGAAALGVAAAIILWVLPLPMEQLRLEPPRAAQPPAMALEIRPPKAAQPPAMATELQPRASAAPLPLSLAAPIKMARRQSVVTSESPRQPGWQTQATWQSQAARQSPATWQGLEPSVEIAIPGDALFAPGAVPPGFNFAADLSIGGDGSPRVLRVQPGVFLK